LDHAWDALDEARDTSVVREMLARGQVVLHRLCVRVLGAQQSLAVGQVCSDRPVASAVRPAARRRAAPNDPSLRREPSVERYLYGDTPM